MKQFLLIAGILGATWTMVAAAETAPAAAPTPAATSAASLFGDEVVARGKGFEIKRGQLDDAYIAFQAARGQGVPEDQRGLLEAQLLDRLITVAVLKRRATPADQTNALAAGEAAIATVKSQALSEAAFNRQILASGMTPAQFRAQMLERALCEEVMEREGKALVTISTEQARKFYETNSARFQEPEVVRVRKIFLATRDVASGQELPAATQKEKKQLAEKILERARAGEDFSGLAVEFTEDGAVKGKGEEFTLARGEAAPEIEAAAFALGAGQVSDVVTTYYGHHLLKLSEKIPARRKEFARVEESIKKLLLLEEMLKLDYLDKIKKEAGVEILLPSAKP